MILCLAADHSPRAAYLVYMKVGERGQTRALRPVGRRRQPGQMDQDSDPPNRIRLIGAPKPTQKAPSRALSSGKGTSQQAKEPSHSPMICTLTFRSRARVWSKSAK
jgi:hypothetical protein